MTYFVYNLDDLELGRIWKTLLSFRSRVGTRRFVRLSRLDLGWNAVIMRMELCRMSVESVCAQRTFVISTHYST